MTPSEVYVSIHSKDEDLYPMSNTHALKPQPSILLRPRCPPSLMRKTFFTPVTASLQKDASFICTIRAQPHTCAQQYICNSYPTL